MASVLSLDQDMKKLRLARYTPGAANEVRAWVEETLGERLAPGDVLDALKDGVALCRLANLALPAPAIRFKKSAMPFVQMENISHFLRACEQPPLSLPAHDRFLTVDLYEAKDPAQVVQCLGAFSRVAHSINPSKFPSAIGPRRAGAMSPNMTGGSVGRGDRHSPTKMSAAVAGTGRALSPALSGGSNSSTGGTTSPPATTTSWSKKTDQGITAPAWNIAQYGYMGGASQGNQGISFGARRQITSAAPHVPSLAEKERRRREQEVEDERLRRVAEEAEAKRRVELAAEEERARAEEQRRWEEQAQKAREEERREVARQKREWEDEERRWKEAEEKAREEERMEAERLRKEKEKSQSRSRANSAILRGQNLSEYQREVRSRTGSRQVSANFADAERKDQRDHVRELERQLEEAKRREAEYELERQQRVPRDDRDRDGSRKRSKSRTRARSSSRPRTERSRSRTAQPGAEEADQQVPSRQDSQASWTGDESEFLSSPHWQNDSASRISNARPLPTPTRTRTPTQNDTPTGKGSGLRPLPNPNSYSSPPPSRPTRNGTERFLSPKLAPAGPKHSAVGTAANSNPSLAVGTSGEQAAETTRRLLSQQKSKAVGWASTSLLEREMERERERQREWEEGQKESAGRVKDAGAAIGPAGEGWDAHQYGYLGGDGQNRGDAGIGFGGRRQIIGPRPQR